MIGTEYNDSLPKIGGRRRRRQSIFIGGMQRWQRRTLPPTSPVTNRGLERKRERREGGEREERERRERGGEEREEREREKISKAASGGGI